jgi:hypothetical protein
MYPKNSAAPPRIYVGSVVQISDGAVQTSGVAITVTPEGGTETASGGTIAYSTKGGVWYSPTQAETNYSAFIVEASKTGCIPVGVTVVTTESPISGRVVLVVAGSAAIAADVGNSATSFKTTLTDATNDYWKDCLLRITSGALIKQVKRVSAYNGSTKVISVVGGFTGIPADDVTFDLINQ